MPGPAGVFAMPGAVVAAKHLAVKASTYADVTTFASAAFSTMIAKWLWKTCPEWLKEDISFKHLLRTSEDISEEDISHLGDIVNKLDELAKKSKEIDIVVPQLHAALLAYIQLTGQLKIANLKNKERKDRKLTRDYAFRAAGEKQSVESLWITEYREALKYATWAYYKDTEVLNIKLQKRGYKLITHNFASRPGNVSYYLALSPIENTLILGIRGTSSLEDILTDCCGSAVPHNKQGGDDNFMEEMGIEITELDGILEGENDDTGNDVRCHEGILVASRRLLDEIDEHIQNWVIGAKWQLLLCGHSLGAGAATIAAVLLRSRYSQLAAEDNDQVEVYAFAPPPVLDHDSALNASSFCTSFVHNSDLIPRCSMYNLAVFLECLLRVHERLVEEDINPTSALSTAAFFKKLAEGNSGEPLLSEAQMNETIRKAQEKIDMKQPNHLFIPGTVYLSFNPWDQMDEQEGKEDDEVVWECVETDGTAPVFRYLELDGARMFMDHVTSTYYEVLNMDYNF